VKHTKILATFGPAIDDPDRLRELVSAGVNLFRVNCSHGESADFCRAAATIRQATARACFPIGLLFDISGPKLRLDRFEGSLDIAEGTELTLVADRTDLAHRLIAVNHPAVIASLRVDDRLFMDDGQFLFHVTARTEQAVTVRSHSSGKLLGGKGINLPGVPLPIPTITAKDRQDIETAVRCGADYIALSFVRSADDVVQARELIAAAGGGPKVIAKLEKREAIDRLDEIMSAADGVMIARGDLGVELPPEVLPRLQRHIIKVANKFHKPVIVATQMLESMRFNPRPTRAEVNDVASAVLDFVDAVMLSAETATGKFPVEAARMMTQVITATEEALPAASAVRVERTVTDPVPQAIADAVSFVQEQGTARVVFAFTSSGFTAQLISNLFSPYPIIALTLNRCVMSALSLHRSVYPVLVEQPASFDEIARLVSAIGRAYAGVRPGDRVVVTGGAPFGQMKPTNFMMIVTILDERESG